MLSFTKWYVGTRYYYHCTPKNLNQSLRVNYAALLTNPLKKTWLAKKWVVPTSYLLASSGPPRSGVYSAKKGTPQSNNVVYMDC